MRVGLAVFLATAVAFPAHAETSGELSLANWASSPRIKEIRAIQQEISAGLKGKRYRVTARHFDIKSPACGNTYPIRAESLAQDAQGRVRRLRVEQVVSHGELLTIERYYDENGFLRFAFTDQGGGEETRIYLGPQGNVFWAVEGKGKDITRHDAAADDWEVAPNTAEKARATFNEAQPCPELKR